MLEYAKQDLKNKIITENSEEYYYKLVAERTEKLHTFKMVGDFVFGGIFSLASAICFILIYENCWTRSAFRPIKITQNRSII